MEKKHPGAGRISANRWRDPEKPTCTTWDGNGNPAPVQELHKCLQKEIEQTSGKEKDLRMSEYVKFFMPWQEESKRRGDKRKVKQNKQSEKPPTEIVNPPPYQPPPPASAPPDSEQQPQPCPPISKNPFVKSQDPYAAARQQLNSTTHINPPTSGFPPPLFPPTLGQFPLIQVPNPNYGRATGPAGEDGVIPRDQLTFTYTYQPWTAEDRKNVLKDVPPLNEGHHQWRNAVDIIRSDWHLNGREMLQVLQDLLGLKLARVRGNFTGNRPDGEPLRGDELVQALNPVYDRIKTELAPRPDYGKIGDTKQKEDESASDFLDRLRPVFRQNSGLEYDESPNTPFEQQLKNAFLKGLLPKVRAHVDKHWVTQNTGSLADALQHAEHAVKVQKNKAAQTGVFVVTTEGDLVAYAGKNPQQQKGKGRRQHTGDKGGDRRCYNCDREGHFARDCRSKPRDRRDRRDRCRGEGRDRDRYDCSNRRDRQDSEEEDNSRER
ncbi:unnamed protein product [Oreochromis niloticus]|nr:unnamed protein product [Mustela putorius furo]CAI5697339.1 unnamed protein product [Mustela putorius furo]